MFSDIFYVCEIIPYNFFNSKIFIYIYKSISNTIFSFHICMHFPPLKLRVRLRTPFVITSRNFQITISIVNIVFIKNSILQGSKIKFQYNNKIKYYTLLIF